MELSAKTPTSRNAWWSLRRRGAKRREWFELRQRDRGGKALVGYGAAKDGWDGHNYYGRYADFAGHNFPQHLIPFNGAFAVQVGDVMPTYSILQDVTIDGKPLEQVGVGFNRQLLGDMLRKQYDFRGVILSDWAITRDCPEACRNGASAGNKAAAQDIGMPWGSGRPDGGAALCQGH
jgi:beta-glucosidase